MSNDVRELTSAIASGNPEALSRFYRDWFDFALHEAHRCTGGGRGGGERGGRDEHFCLDAVQETMLRVIKRMKPLDSEAALVAWLKTAVRSACVDLLRKELRMRKRERARAAEHPEVAIDATSHTAHETQETLAWLRDELSRIDPVTASALDMRFRLNFTLARIGKALHLRTGAVDGRINRSVAQLRASLPPHAAHHAAPHASPDSAPSQEDAHE